MELFLAAIESILRIDVFLALLSGAVGGVIIGAIPGVGPAVAIAIILPATFSLEPIVGLTLLLGIYGASMYGGAIPAILINTPGTTVGNWTWRFRWDQVPAGLADNIRSTLAHYDRLPARLSDPALEHTA